jgi:hypothetical protein
MVACAASLAVVAPSSPAVASPGRVIISGGVHIDNHDHSHGRVYTSGQVRGPAYGVVHGDRCGCGDCFARREYARGHSRGEAAGAHQGFRDGVNGKIFCADVRDDLRCESRPFVDGYVSSFGTSYRYAFDQGHFERSRACRPVHRAHARW